MLADLVLLACGTVMLIAAYVVLATSGRLEISLRVAAALLVGAWGADSLATAMGGHAAWRDLLGPLGVALWVGQALLRRRGLPMRRSTDWTQLDEV